MKPSFFYNLKVIYKQILILKNVWSLQMCQNILNDILWKDLSIMKLFPFRIHFIWCMEFVWVSIAELIKEICISAEKYLFVGIPCKTFYFFQICYFSNFQTTKKWQVVSVNFHFTPWKMAGLITHICPVFHQLTASCFFHNSGQTYWNALQIQGKNNFIQNGKFIGFKLWTFTLVKS